MQKLSLICLLAALPICATAGDRNKEEMVFCHGSDNTTIVIELWKPSQYGVALHCLHASFSTDMTACAPNGGWGLGSNDDMANLVEVTNDWSTAHNHEAGKVTASAGSRGVRFNAQIGKGVGSNLSFRWKFAMERRSGEAIWFGNDGHQVKYECEVSG